MGNGLFVEAEAGEGEVGEVLQLVGGEDEDGDGVLAVEDGGLDGEIEVVNGGDLLKVVVVLLVDEVGGLEAEGVECVCDDSGDYVALPQEEVENADGVEVQIEPEEGVEDGLSRRRGEYICSE